MADNVYSSAKIISKNEEIQKYELGNFINSKVENNVVTTSNTILGADVKLSPFLLASSHITNISGKNLYISFSFLNITQNMLQTSLKLPTNWQKMHFQTKILFQVITMLNQFIDIHKAINKQI